MELDVHLTREGDEPWGFEFCGGADHDYPLTIDKVFPCTPAQRGGLQAGDVVARLGDTLTCDLTLEAARARVADAIGSLSFGICRGLYDPVLDDFEPIYEPTDRADSDLRSEPTEVLDPRDLSLDDPNILDPRITDPSLWDSGYATRPLTETRSLTASPFVPNTKPYRPFSTEPLEVPPLDDPIILNPDYKDTVKFNNITLNPEEDELLRLLSLDRQIEPKFKLPISEKYDPNWDKKVQTMLEKCAEGGQRATQQVEKELLDYSVKSETSFTEESLSFAHEYVAETTDTVNKEVTTNVTMRKECDIKQIELTASEIVEESIERAVSVTEDIKKEIEEELRASMTRELQENETLTDFKTDKEEHKSMRNESTEHDVKSEKIVSEKMLHLDDLKEEFKSKVLNEESKMTAKNQNNIETNNETRKSYVEGSEKINKVFESTTESNAEKQSVSSRKKAQMEEIKSDNQFKKEHTETFSNETKKTEDKQRAYMIGLQTIPHIKGFVQSSYHFDLLLRTFFIHLTDVMVALSRFILTQPTSELEMKAEKVVKEKLIKEFVSHDGQQIETRNTESKLKESSTKKTEDTYEKQNVVETKDEKSIIKSEAQQQICQKETTKQHESKHDGLDEINRVDVEMRKKTGSEMAQRTQRKSKDLTQKMDAVISEFETKSGIEEKVEGTEQGRRSRSRSRIEEEVMKESDPLDWLDKVDSHRTSQERSVTTVEKGYHDYTESKESKRTEEITHLSRTTKTLPGKQMYVAVVESHVYTNTEAILEDQVAEISKTTSIQNSEKTSAAKESVTAVSCENVALNNFVETEEKRQADKVNIAASQEVVHEKQEVLEAVKNKSEITEEQSKFTVQKMHTAIAAESNETVSESSVKILTATESLETKAAEKQEISHKTAAVEFENITLETTEDVIDTKVGMHEAIRKQDILETIAMETTELVDECNIQTFETKHVESKIASVTSEENYKSTAESSVEVVLEASKEVKTEYKVKEQQANSKIESLSIAVAESTEVGVDDSKLETFVNKEIETNTAKVTSEESYKTAALEVTDVLFETAEEKHSETTNTTEVTIKEEVPHLAVAGIIEVQTEFYKEPRVPTEEEFASLKIVKCEVVEDDECSEIVSESEVNIEQNLEITEEISAHHQYVSESFSQESTSIQSQIVQEQSQTLVQESSKYESSNVQEASFLVTQSSLQSSVCEESVSKKSLHLDISQVSSTSNGIDENNNTPTPSAVPTPLTDEYVFKLEIPLPKTSGTIIIEESPDREDPHIVKKGLVPHIETTIEEQIIYDPPLPTPTEDKVTPVYTKPGLRGGAMPLFRREYIREIERKSSLLASAIDETIKSIEEYKEEVGIDTTDVTLPLPKKKMIFFKTSNDAESDEVVDVTIPLPKKTSKQTNGITNGHVENGAQNGEEETEVEGPPGFKPVVFNPEEYKAKLYEEVTRGSVPPPAEVKPYVDATGEPLGTVQGIVDGLEDAVVDQEIAKELGKPGMTEENIAVLISGESEMLREAHVMGLSRVLKSHMTRPDSSVDFQKIKPLVPSLKDSEVIKALNDEMKKECEERKKKEAIEAKKWTTFLQKPQRPVPRAKCGYPGYVEPEPEQTEAPYKVKIVKQPKPKVAPDYKPEDFDTGPLPWEERALKEPPPPPVPPEEPILIPEQAEFFEAVDPLPESEVPDLEDTGIPLPPTPPPEQPFDQQLPEQPAEQPAEQPEPVPEVESQQVPETKEEKPDTMDQNKMAEQLVNTVKGMVDPKAPLEQQLFQMRAQLAALAQLPCVIQQSLEVLTRQLSAMSRQETHQMSYESEMNMERRQEVEETSMPAIQEYQEQEISQNGQEAIQNGQETTPNGQEETQNGQEDNSVTIVEVQEETVSAEEVAALKREQEAMMEEQKRSEKEKKDRQEQARVEQESRQVKQRAPRVGKPKPVFGPLTPEERPLVLPGGRRWRGPKDAYNEQFIAETLTSQSEIIQGKVMGYESDRLPYDNRINFMKFEKPPVKLDHLENSPTYRLIHNLEDAPMKRTDLLTPVVAEADYRERCRSTTPNTQVKGLM